MCYILKVAYNHIIEIFQLSYYILKIALNFGSRYYCLDYFVTFCFILAYVCVSKFYISKDKRYKDLYQFSSLLLLLEERKTWIDY